MNKPRWRQRFAERFGWTRAERLWIMVCLTATPVLFVVDLLLNGKA